MTFVSYAENFEDVLLWRALRGVRTGFYIDVGATHPDTNSVTRAFHDRGWSGINIVPSPEAVRRLRSARPRDVTLQAKPGAVPGDAGASMARGDAPQHDGEAGRPTDTNEVDATTLVEVCRRYAPQRSDGDIHFLRLDAGGNEAAVLTGADWDTYRPWIVVVRATAVPSAAEANPEWNAGLLQAGYDFAWFDGLNRFYVAADRADALLPHFCNPPNALDDFFRAADAELAGRIATAEGKLYAAETRTHAAEERTERANLQLARQVSLTASAENLFRDYHHALIEAQRLLQTADAERMQAQAQAEAQALQAQAQAAQMQAQVAQMAAAFTVRLEAAEVLRTGAERLLHATRASTSWRVTLPLRAAVKLARGLLGLHGSTAELADLPDDAVPLPVAEKLEAESLAASTQQDRPPAGRSLSSQHGPALRTVHQFCCGSSTGDAITNGMLLTRSLLRKLGYRSEIFVEFRDPALAHELRLLDELPQHGNYVLLHRHPNGHPGFARLLGLRAPKVLLYHNITPPEYLESPGLQGAVRLGRAQLRELKGQVVAALADSEYNALELRALGFDQVQVCPLLIDTARIRRTVAEARSNPAGDRHRRADSVPFTVLFVGRMLQSKGQLELIEAFARFREHFSGPARLVLVGSHGGAGDPYLESLLAAIRRNDLQGNVVITGAIPDAERDSWYSVADLYVSLSEHEGFGVPLVEAMAWGVPVIAWPAGAVAETLGDNGAALLDDPSPSSAAALMLTLAQDRKLRAAMATRGAASLERWEPERYVPRLVQALIRAGAALPEPDLLQTQTALDAKLRFAVAGPIGGTHGLAAMNRALALAIEAERPGRVRVLPVEDAPVADISTVVLHQRAAIAALAGRAPPPSGPEVVISQRDPVYPPVPAGDLPLALVSRDDSLLPADTVAALCTSFRGVLAPTRFVAKALVSSGVCVPVRILGHAPPLSTFRAVAEERRARDADAETTRPFTFLHVSSCDSHTGVDVLLAAYVRAFRAEDQVRLVVKGPGWQDDVAVQLEKLRADNPDAAAVEYIGADLPEQDPAALYREAGAMVLPTRGEGYTVVAAEAMAAGVPLIITGFGGHLDFCGSSEARLVEYDFASARNLSARAGSVWAEPRVDDLAAALREVMGDREAARTRAERAEHRIAEQARPDLVVGRLARTARDLLLAPLPPPLRTAWISTWDVRCGISEYSRHLVGHLPRDMAAGLAILSDLRSAAVEADWNVAGVAVRPAWQRGGGDLSALSAALMREDPHVVVLQHHPAFFPWDRLPQVLGCAGMAERAVAVVLHNSRSLLDLSEEDRQAAAGALAGVARVLVHTVADLNRLKALGLVDNVDLLPHGAHLLRPLRTVRTLDPHRPEVQPLIGCYGFCLPGKGVPELIAALAILRQTWPGARLRLVTADCGSESVPALQACITAIEAARLQDVVEFMTDFLSHEQSLDLLADCDLIVLPTQVSPEASSASVRTALAAGAPVAVTPLALYDEAEDAVLRLPGYSPDAIAAGLSRLLCDAPLRAEGSERRQRWMQDRSWGQVATRLAGMLHGLVADRTT